MLPPKSIKVLGVEISGGLRDRAAIEFVKKRGPLGVCVLGGQSEASTLRLKPPSGLGITLNCSALKKPKSQISHGSVQIQEAEPSEA